MGEGMSGRKQERLEDPFGDKTVDQLIQREQGSSFLDFHFLRCTLSAGFPVARRKVVVWGAKIKVVRRSVAGRNYSQGGVKFPTGGNFLIPGRARERLPLTGRDKQIW